MLRVSIVVQQSLVITELLDQIQTSKLQEIEQSSVIFGHDCTFDPFELVTTGSKQRNITELHEIESSPVTKATETKITTEARALFIFSNSTWFEQANYY